MDTVFQILKMLGCLGMFLFGMSLMSGGLQKFAGDSLRTFIAKMTSNTGKCLLTGFVVTALVQSSTATTLMLVSFVNAGLMTLSHAIGVIMGANIGTTFTAWLFALSFDGSFSLGAIAIPVMFFAFVFYSMKNQRLKSFGEFLMGFAFLFLGLATLKDTSYPLLSSPAMHKLLAPLTGFGYGSILMFIVIGAVMTLMLQSSAATTSITMLLLAAGVVPFDLAVAMVLGENIGTTITSNLAASVANVSAKRTARAHLVFNLFGSLLVIALFRPYLSLNGIIIEALGFPNPCTADFSVLGMSDAEGGVMKAQLAQSLPYSVAIVHTLFNVITTLILVGFIPQIEKIVTRMVPSKEGESESFSLIYLKQGLLSTAELSLDEVRREIYHFGEICLKGYNYVCQAVDATDRDSFEPLRAKLVKYEEITDRIEFEIASYLNKVSESELSDSTRIRIKAMYKIISEMESLGDSGEAISRLLTRKYDHGKTLDADMTAKVNGMLALVRNAYDIMLANLGNKNLRDIQNAYDAEDAINKCRDRLREEHIANIENRAYDYTSGVYYIDLVAELEKIGDFIINISEAAVQMK
ncbi:MAG: Na/Pi cotransporter family protein [Bacteroidaceae bacterium]|nr:Na/Pi cotransporter family protein [Bacteroidaceae bacterium]